MPQEIFVRRVKRLKEQNVLERHILEKSHPNEGLLSFIRVTQVNRDEDKKKKIVLLLTVSKSHNHNIRFGHVYSYKERDFTSRNYSLKKSHALQDVESVQVTYNRQNGHDTDLKNLVEEFSISYMSSNNRINTYTYLPDSGDAMDFLWWLIRSCQFFLHDEPRSNLDQDLLKETDQGWTSFAVGQVYAGGGAYLNETQSDLLELVSAKRSTVVDVGESIVSESIQIPEMSQEEEDNIQFYLDSMGLDLASIGDLEHKLLNEMAVIERDNFETLFDERSISNGEYVVSMIDDASIELQEMANWINEHHDDITKMKEGIELFEDTNKKLELLETNHEKLKDTLEKMLRTLQLKGDYLKHMHEPDFEHDLEDVIMGATELHRAMVMTLDGGLEKLKAVKEVRKSNNELKNNFCTHVVRFMESKFQQLARDLPDHGGVDVGNALQFPKIIPEKACIHHKVLEKYSDLMRIVEKLDFNVYVSLRQKYVSVFSKVHEATLREFINALKQKVIVEDKRSVFQNFPDYVLGAERNITRRGHRGGVSRTPSIPDDIPPHNHPRGGRNRRRPNQPSPRNSNMGTDRSSTSVAVALSGKKLVTKIFRDCLDDTLPLVLTEQDFCSRFFGRHLDSNTNSTDRGSISVSGADVEDADGSHADDSDDALSAMPQTEAANVPAGGDSQGGTEAGGEGALQGLHPLLRSTSLTFRKRGGRRRGTSDRPHVAANPEEMKNEQDIVEMLSGLFSLLEPELKEIGTWGDKMDHFYSLNMVVDIEVIKAKYFGRSMYIVEMMGNLDMYLRLLFNEFIDNAVNWILNFRVPSKRCGVISPFLKFPSFVERIESVVRDLDSGAADTTYTKLLVSMFRTLDCIAEQDSKYKDVVIMENCHHFWRIFYNRKDPMPSALVQAVDKAKAMYWAHLDTYVAWNVKYELNALTKFWDNIDDQLESVTPEDLQFTPGLSKHDLRSVCKDHLSYKIIEKGISNIFKRVQKHLQENFLLVSEVWSEISKTFLKRFRSFEDLVKKAYQSESLAVSSDEVAAMFEKLQQTLPPIDNDDETSIGTLSRDASIMSYMTQTNDSEHYRRSSIGMVGSTEDFIDMDMLYEA